MVVALSVAMLAASGASATAQATHPRIVETARAAAAANSAAPHGPEPDANGGTARQDATPVADYRSIVAEAQVHALGQNRQTNETALTPEAVIAVDDHWSLAELRGDTAWLGSLLLPDYRSIRTDGSTWDRKTLLDRATRNRGHGSKALESFNAWLKAHPMNESVILHGNVAILAFSDPKTGHVRMSNVFVHENGRWLALYSQLMKTK